MAYETIPLEAALKILKVRVEDGKEYVHTFTNPTAGMLVGADWQRSTLEAAMRAAPAIMEAGAAAKATGHGVAIVYEGRGLFIATLQE